MSERGTALVTGASSGIGEAFARLLAEEGFDLVITARREDRLQQIAAELPGQVEVIAADLGAREALDNLMAQLDGTQIDLLINNAGMDIGQDFHTAEAARLDALIDVNIRALTQLTHHFAGKMIQQGSGRILNVASVAAFHPIPAMGLYAASKAFVLSLSESLAETLRGTGVSITVLCPGITDTELVEKSIIEQAPPPLVSDPASVAKEGYRALMNREVICVPGGANKLALTWAQHQPRWLIRNVGGFAQRFLKGKGGKG